MHHQECVFTAGAVANSMYLTATGTYIHTDAGLTVPYNT